MKNTFLSGQLRKNVQQYIAKVNNDMDLLD